MRFRSFQDRLRVPKVTSKLVVYIERWRVIEATNLRFLPRQRTPNSAHKRACWSDWRALQTIFSLPPPGLSRPTERVKTPSRRTTTAVITSVLDRWQSDPSVWLQRLDDGSSDWHVRVDEFLAWSNSARDSQVLMIAEIGCNCNSRFRENRRRLGKPINRLLVILSRRPSNIFGNWARLENYILYMIVVKLSTIKEKA